MSEIAKALANAAKITEAGHLQRAHQKSAEAVRRNQNREFIWAGLLACVVLAILGAFLIHSSSPPPADSAVAVAKIAVDPQPLPIAPIRPKPELESALENLVIKALIKGPSPRVLIGDRAIGVGDELTPGLILSGIEGRELMATDAQGLRYLKKM